MEVVAVRVRHQNRGHAGQAQAHARARVEEGDKGGVAARAALTMVALKHTLAWL